MEMNREVEKKCFILQPVLLVSYFKNEKAPGYSGGLFLFTAAYIKNQ